MLDDLLSRTNGLDAVLFSNDDMAIGGVFHCMANGIALKSQLVDPRFSYRAEDVVMTLERVCWHLGYPRTIRVDQGTEFVSRDLDLWAYAKGVTLDFSRPGKPTDNAFIEAFNSKFRSECLNAHWFMSLDDARTKMEDWRRYYNEERPHSGIGQKVPILLHNTGGASSPSSVKEAENSSLS